MPTVNAFDALPEDMRAPVREFAELVRSLGEGNVRGLVLFGAIAAGSFDASRHTARSVLMVERVDLAMLRRIAENGVRFGKQRIAAPLLMTPAYIRESLDTFPLEFIEIHQNHVAIFGDDAFADLTFADADIRHQCERELKVLAMSLRQGLLAAAGRDKVLSEIQQGVGEGLLRIMRGMLWLKGRRDAQSAPQVIAEIENLTSRKLTGVRHALTEQAAGWEQFEQLYRDIEALGGIVDAW